MVQIFITGDDTGDVTVGSDPTAEGTVFAFEWDFIANSFSSPSEADLEDPIFSSWDISTPPEFGVATISSPGFSADWTYVLDESNPAVQDLEFGETLQDSFVIRAIAFDDDDIFAGFKTVDITIFGVCFANGSLIETINGPVAVEDLRPGQLLATQDKGFQPVIWTGGQWYNEDDWFFDESLLPVRISAEALGENEPSCDLLVSQQHRILLCRPELELYFGVHEALIPAKHLCGLPGIEIITPKETLGYFHVLCGDHHILKAEGLSAESMFLGDETLHALPPSTLNQLLLTFASVDERQGNSPWVTKTCRFVLNRKETELLFTST
ncbi:MAG: Hint domain-containing protein, partial [Hyphomicrobiales bacterium]